MERGAAMGDGAGAVCALDVRRADSVAVSLLSVEEPTGTLDTAVFDAATGALYRYNVLRYAVHARLAEQRGAARQAAA